VPGQRRRLGGGLRAAVHDHGQRSVQEELGGAPALGRGEQDPLPGRPERQDSVEAGRRQEL